MEVLKENLPEDSIGGVNLKNPLQNNENVNWKIFANPLKYNLLDELTLIGKQKYRIYISLSSEDEHWDQFVLSVQGSCPFQLCGWTAVKEIERWRFLRIIYTDINYNIIAGYQLLIKKFPFIGNVAYLNRGPVLKSNDNPLLKKILADFEIFLSKNNIKVTVINPPESPNKIFEVLNSKYILDSSHRLINAEAEIDLSADEDILHRNLLRMRKQNIRKAETYQYKIIEGDENELESFFYLMSETCKRNNVRPNPPSLDSLKIVWNYYHTKMNLLKLYKFYIDDELTSAILTFEYQDTFTPWKYGWSGKKSSYKPNDVFHWELLKLAKKKGFRKYNIGGINLTIAEKFLNHKQLTKSEIKSSTFFKMGFGCYIKRLPDSILLIPNPFYRFLYRFYTYLKIEKESIKKLIRNNLNSFLSFIKTLIF